MTEADFHNIDPEKATMGVTVAEYMRLTKEVERLTKENALLWYLYGEDSESPRRVLQDRAEYLQARVDQLQTIYEEAEAEVERLRDDLDRAKDYLWYADEEAYRRHYPGTAREREEGDVAS